jgi:thiol-disulfide isomerase/thioredoxin
MIRLAALFTCFIGARIDSAVVELDGTLFESAMNDQPMLLVNFYVPWCGHSRRLQPELAEAARQLDGRVTVARVDCSKHPALAQRFHVRAHPTLKLFVSGFPVDYRRKGTAGEIVAYCERMQAPPIASVDSLEAALNFVQSEELAVLVFMTQRQAVDRFAKLERIALRWRPDVAFANVQNGACDSDSQCSKQYGCNHVCDFQNLSSKSLRSTIPHCMSCSGAASGAWRTARRRTTVLRIRR